MAQVGKSSFNFEDLIDFVDFSSFRFLLTALLGNKIAIATPKYLVIVEDNVRLDQKREALASKNLLDSFEDDRLQTVVEFGEISGRPTAMAWLSVDIVCVGFESGGLSCFNPFGDTITEIEFTSSMVCSIRTFRNPDPSITELDVWVLYENKFVVSIPLSHLLGATGNLSRYYIKFKLMDQESVQDFTVLPEAHSMNIFEAEFNSPSSSFVVAGVESSLSLYNIGGKRHFQHLGKLASYVRDRVGSALSKTVGNALVSFFGSTGGSEPSTIEDDYTPITSSLDFDESKKRRMIRLSLDPTGKLLATADTLGRVLLFDMRCVTTAIRIWKGIREARFAWTMDQAPSNNSSVNDETCPQVSRRYQLSLAIYAPQLGLLSLYQARHGPCLRSIPVGPQCQIFTLQETTMSGDTLHKCGLLKVLDGSPTLHLSVVSPFDHEDDDIDLNEIQAQSEAMQKKHKDSKTSGGAQFCDLVRPAFGIVSPFRYAHSSKSSNIEVHDECSRFMLKVERLLKEALLLVKNGHDALSDGQGEHRKDGVEHAMADIEHRLWILLSSSASRSLFLSSVDDEKKDCQGVALLLHCLSVIERVEITMYEQQSMAENAQCEISPQPSSLGAKSHNGNSKECGSLYFSLQFHRNLCRLLEDIGHSVVSKCCFEEQSDMCSFPSVLVEYAQNRAKLVKAYTMLMDINSQLSLSEMTVLAAQESPVDGNADTSKNKKNSSVAKSSFREEAIHWNSRVLRPYSQQEQPPSPASPVNEVSIHSNAPHGEGSGDPVVSQINPLSLLFDTGANSTPDNTKVMLSPHQSCSLRYRSIVFNSNLVANYARISKISSQEMLSSSAQSSFPIAESLSTKDNNLPLDPSTPPQVTRMLRCPQSPSVFQPSAVGRYVPFAVFLCFHEQRTTRVRVHEEHARLVAYSDGESISFGDYCKRINRHGAHDAHSESDSDSDSDSDIDDEEGESHAHGENNKSSHESKRIQRRHLKMLFKVSEVKFDFKAFALLLDSNSQYLNESAWHGGLNSSSEGPSLQFLGDAVCSGLPSWMAREVLSFLCLPLFGDVFSVQTVLTVFEMIGLGESGLGLVRTLPLVLLFLEAQPINLIHHHLVNKSLQASPIQRWLRDSLQQFQVFMASDVDDVNDAVVVDHEITEDRKGSPERSVPSGKEMNGKRNYLKARKKKALLRLLTNVIASRSDITEDESNSHGIASSAAPSLDEVIRYLLRPAWLLVRKSFHLEFAFSVVSLVIEVLEGANDQLERKTFGDMSLNGTLQAWRVLARQLRVGLLICGRAGGKVSVEELGNGEVSLYALLATDTLCFAMQPEQAIEHELRCEEVYNRRAGVENNTSTSSSNNANNNKKKSSSSARDSTDGGGALLAWGSSADSRWKELIGIAEMEDLVLQESVSAGSLQSACKGLENELHQISLNLAILLSDVSSRLSSLVLPSSMNSTPFASFSPTSKSPTAGPIQVRTTRNQSNKLSSERDAKEGKKIRRRRPLLLFFPSHNQSLPLASYRSCALAERWRKRPKRVDLLSLASGHLFPLPPATRGAVAELILTSHVFPLLYEFLIIEEGGRHHGGLIKSEGASSQLKFNETQDLVVVIADSKLAPQFVHGGLELLKMCLTSPEDFNSVEDCKSPDHSSSSKPQQSLGRGRGMSFSGDVLNEMSLQAHSDEDMAPESWPPTQDARLCDTMRRFHEKGGVCDDAVKYHMALLWVLQLRTQCGLRGVKLSELFGSSLLNSFVCDTALQKPPTDEVAGNESTFYCQYQRQKSDIAHLISRKSGSNDLPTSGKAIAKMHNLREEFLMQCFRRLGSASSAMVYKIADIWGFDCRTVRIGHLRIMLQLGLDQAAEELIGQIDDTSLVVETIIDGLRRRMGQCLAGMERLQSCGPLLASFDPDCYAWAREVSSPLDPQDIEELIEGKRSIVSFDVPASRHLLIRVQALLLLVPQVHRDDKWKKQKEDCDALLTLYSSLTPSELKATLKNSGLKL